VFDSRSVCSGFEKCRYERRREVRIDRIAVAPQQPHAAGYPMSQRECSGFNAPGFSVAAGDEVEGGPEAN
jgi:hypothetical protein